MDRPTSSFESELRISLKPVSAILVILGVVLVFVGEFQLIPYEGSS